MKITEAQARSWKHNLNLSNIPRAIKEKLFQGEEYEVRAKQLHDADKTIREVALGQNFYGISVKQAVQIAQNGAKNHKYIDSAYGVSIFLEILQRIIDEGKQAAVELSELPTKEFEVSDPDALEHFVNKDQAKQAGIKDIYRSIFGDPLEKAYARQIAMHRKVLDGLVNFATSSLNELLLCFHRMGYANASNNFLGWVKEFENIKKIHARLNTKFISTYKQSIKFFVDMAAKGLNEGSAQSIKGITEKLHIQPEPEAIKPEPVVQQEAPKAEVVPQEDSLAEFRKFVEEEKAKRPVAEKEYADLTSRQTKDVEQIAQLQSELKNKTEEPQKLIDTLDEWAHKNSPVLDPYGNIIAELGNGDITLFNILDRDNNPIVMDVWSLPKVMEAIPGLDTLFSKHTPIKDQSIVNSLLGKIEEIAPEVKEKRGRGRPPGVKNKPKDEPQAAVVSEAPVAAPVVQEAPKVEPVPEVVPEPIVEQPAAPINQNVPEQYSEANLAAMKPTERGALINSITDTSLLDAISKYNNSNVRFAIAAGKNTSQDTLFNLAQDKDEDVSKMAVSQINTPLLLTELAKSRSPSVRYFVLNNKITPDDIKINLANDPEVRKRKNKDDADKKRLGVTPSMEKELAQRAPYVAPEKVNEVIPEVAPEVVPKEAPKATDYLNELSAKELKTLAQDVKTPDDVLLAIIEKSTDDFFTQLPAVNNIKNPDVLAKVTNPDLKSAVEKRLVDLGSTLKPVEAPVPTVEQKPTEAPKVEEPTSEEPAKLEGMPEPPKMTKEEKQAIQNSLVFIILPEDFDGNEKGKVQRQAKEYYSKDYPKAQIVVDREKRIKSMLEKNPEYLSRTVKLIKYEDFINKKKKTPMRRAEFYNNLVKLADKNNPYLIANAMLEYSGEIDSVDPELSVQLLNKAIEILNG